MPTVQIKLKEARDGHPVDAILPVEEGIADVYIRAGIAEKYVAPPAGGDGAEAVDQITALVIKRLIDSAKQSPIERPSIVTQLADLGRFAEAKDHGNLSEFVQSVGFTLPSFAGTSAQKRAGEILTNKYKSVPSKSFETDWQAAQTKGFGVDQAVHKAGVTMTETQGSIGGFSIPVQFYPEIIKLAYEESEVFRRVRKYPMTGLQMNIPALDYSQGGSGASPYLAGMIAQWFAEGGGFTQTNLSIRQVEMKANILGGYTQATRTLVADNAVGLTQILTEMMGRTISYYTTLSIVSGTGNAQPQGILKAAAAIAVNRTGDTTNGTTLADLATMKAKLLPGSAKRAMWLIPPSFEAFLYQMNDKSGRVVFLPNFPGNQGGPASYTGLGLLLGIPFEVSQYPASQGSSGDIILFDPEAYGWAERQDLEIGVSEHVGFLSNLLTWRFLFRGDGKSRINASLTLQNGDVVSPFVYRN